MKYADRDSIIKECTELTLKRRRNDIEETLHCYEQNLITLADVKMIFKVFCRVTNLRRFKNELSDFEVMQASIQMTNQLIDEK